MLKSIKLFEQLFIVSIVIGILANILTFSTVGLPAEATYMVVGIQILTFAIILSLVLLTSRKKSNIAKWLLVILFAIGLLAILAQPGLILANGITSIIGIIQTLIQAAAVYFLFTKEARDWFASKD